MKKMILLTAFCAASLMYAKNTVVNNSLESKEGVKAKEKENTVKAFGCMQVFIETSCGLNSNTTWCSEWGLACLMSDAEAMEQINCHQ